MNIYHDVPRIYWKQHQGSLTFIGFGSAEEILAKGKDRFSLVNKQSSELFNKLVAYADDVPVYVRPRIFGGFSFQVDEPKDRWWKSYPEAKMILPKILFTNNSNKTWATINIKVDKESKESDLADRLKQEKQSVLERIESLNDGQNERPDNVVAEISWLVNVEKWHHMIGGAHDLMSDKELKKVVLARTCQIDLSEPINIYSILEKLGQEYPDCYTFMFEFAPKQIFFGVSPETLVFVDKSEFQTIALAGSIGRGIDTFEDDELGNILLNSEKDLYEHELVVKALQERLSQVTDSLTISGKPGLRKLQNIQHIETRFFGLLKENSNVFSLLSTLHPTPALGGTPRPMALKYIREAEPFSRGWYAGPVGWVDSQGDGLFAVAIRSGVMDQNSICLYAGAGIVEASDPVMEWEETKIKFKPILNILSTVGVQIEIS